MEKKMRRKERKDKAVRLKAGTNEKLRSNANAVGICAVRGANTHYRSNITIYENKGRKRSLAAPESCGAGGAVKRVRERGRQAGRGKPPWRAR